MSNRNDFTARTKSIIAGRAGYRCSFPGCNLVLIGPGKNNDDVICIGECAHIFSAAAGGPRGKTILNKTNIKSAGNGIFLCRNHHKIIDSNAGNEYSPSALLEYKGRHEAQIAKQLGKYSLSSGWIKSVLFRGSVVFKNDIIIRLGKVTHFYGENNTGKSFVCNCINNAISGDKQFAKNYEIVFKIDNGTDNDDELVISSDPKSGKRFSLNKKPSPISPVNLKVICLLRDIKFSSDHISDISRCFDIDEETVLSALHNEFFDGLSTKIVDIKTHRKKPYLVRKITIKNVSGYPIELDMCSSSEVAIFLAEIGIVLSRHYSYQATVLYIIDWCNIKTLDDRNMNQLLVLLESNNNLFQTIIISPNEMPKLLWNGWAFAKFQKTVPDTVIEQDEF